MRILITNLLLAGRSGTEVVTEQLADGFRRRGDEVAILVSRAGPQADQLRWRGHVVCERAAELPWRPDVIHAHHNVMAMVAIARFPGVPVVFTCHDATLAYDRTPLHPAIRQWVAVDRLCRDRLAADGVDTAHIHLIPNAVDEEAYPQRGALPAAPRRALALTKNGAHLAALKKACARACLPLDVIGAGVGQVTDRLGEILPDYDLVFATARGALEAAYCGCSVIVADARGFAGRLTADVLPAWREENLGRGILSHPPSEAAFLEAIEGYDAADSARVTDALRQEAGLMAQIDAFHAVYEDVLALPPAAGEEAGARHMAAFLEEFVPAADRNRGWSGLVRDSGAGDLADTAGLDAIRASLTDPLLAEVRRVAVRADDQVFPASAFRTLTGALVSGRLVCDLAGNDGFAVFGPYVSLPTGRWNVAFDLAWVRPEGEEAFAELDVYVGERTRLGAVYIAPVPASRGLITPVIDFEHTEGAQTVEFRVHARNFTAGRLYFDGARLTRLG